MENITLTKKPRVLITGCSTGIGRALAAEFVKRGCEVLATARRLEALEGIDGVKKAVVDVNKPETLAAAVAEFANDGFSAFGPLIEQELGTVEDILRTNVVGVVAASQAVAAGMIARRSGTIVVTGSVSGQMVTPYAGAYCASKAAVTAVCSALRMELAPLGIAVMEVLTPARS